jgi:hypothetical protein
LERLPGVLDDLGVLVDKVHLVAAVFEHTGRSVPDAPGSSDDDVEVVGRWRGGGGHKW